MNTHIEGCGLNNDQYESHEVSCQIYELTSVKMVKVLHVECKQCKRYAIHTIWHLVFNYIVGV